MSAEKQSLTKPIIILLSILILFDLATIAGILIHGKANFPELIKHLKT